MGKKVYSLRGSSFGFPNHDSGGWFREVSDDEFRWLGANGKIKEFDGNYYEDDAQNENRKDYDYYEPEKTGGFLSGLYLNPGETLKSIASIVFILGVIASLILAITFGRSISVEYLLSGESSFDFGRFCAIFISGIIVSYLSGLGLAAFGDLVQNANEINQKLK